MLIDPDDDDDDSNAGSDIDVLSDVDTSCIVDGDTCNSDDLAMKFHAHVFAPDWMASQITSDWRLILTSEGQHSLNEIDFGIRPALVPVRTRGYR